MKTLHLSPYIEFQHWQYYKSRQHFDQLLDVRDYKVHVTKVAKICFNDTSRVIAATPKLAMNNKEVIKVRFDNVKES